jgi:hypothetical protein
MALFARFQHRPQLREPAAGTAVLAAAPFVPSLSEEIQRQLKTARSQVFAYSEFAKQADCVRCGAPKQLPSKTAYVYCDYCGALVDYDFRMANYGTNAALTNQVYAYLFSPVQALVERAIAERDLDRYRALLRPVYAEWLRQCPQAGSPRNISDDGFRERNVIYQVESLACQDFDPGLRAARHRLAAITIPLEQAVQAGGGRLYGDAIWPVAEAFKELTDSNYAAMERNGVLELDPEQAPIEVWLRMEYSCFCQNWLAKVPDDIAGHLLAYFGLRDTYTKVDLSAFSTRRCGGCGDELKIAPGARTVMCGSCGRGLDIAGGEVGCRVCGTQFCLPAGVSALNCPHCHSATQRA